MVNSPADPRRAGMAMIMVMGAVAVVFAIGMSLLAGLPATARASNNVIDRDAAVYLAESGLVEALHRLNNPPEGQSIWSGVTGRSLAGLNGTYDVAIVDLGDNTYRVDATGHAPGRSGVHVSRTVSMTVAIEESVAGMTTTQSAVFSGGAIPPGAHIKGDVHINGHAINLGTIEGVLSATGFVLTSPWNVEGKEQGADPVDLPEIKLDDYTNYAYGGGSYGAQVYATDDLDDLPDTLDASGSGNPLGVIVIDGDLTLDDDLKIQNSILVVRGDLDLNGHELKVQGNSSVDHITLIVEDDLRFSGNRPQLEVKNGPVYVGDEIRSEPFTSNAKLEAEQGVFAVQGLPLFFSGSVEIDYPDVRENGSASFSFFGSGAGGGGGGSRTVTVLNYTQ